MISVKTKIKLKKINLVKLKLNLKILIWLKQTLKFKN